MTPELYETFLRKKDAILATGIDFINLAALHLNPTNLANYWGENLYLCRRGYVSPGFPRSHNRRGGRWPRPPLVSLPTFGRFAAFGGNSPQG